MFTLPPLRALAVWCVSWLRLDGWLIGRGPLKGGAVAAWTQRATRQRAAPAPCRPVVRCSGSKRRGPGRVR